MQKNNPWVRNRWGGVLLLAMLGLGVASAETKKSDAKKTEASQPAVADSEAVAPMDKPLIIVEGLHITARDYANFLQGNPDYVKKAVDSETGKAEALREMVSVYLMRRAMYAEGLLNAKNPSPERKELTDAYEELAKRHFPRPPKADDAAAYAYYQAHPGDFGIPTMTRLREIAIYVPKGAAESVKGAARERVGMALKRIEAGESFEQVARDSTENPLGKLTGGDIGFVDLEQEQQAWLKSVVGELKLGQHTQVLERPDGFEILEVTDIRPGLVSPFANVRDQAIKAVGDQAQKKLRDAYVRELASKAKVEVVMPNIQALFPNGIFPEVKKP